MNCILVSALDRIFDMLAVEVEKSQQAAQVVFGMIAVDDEFPIGLTTLEVGLYQADSPGKVPAKADPGEGENCRNHCSPSAGMRFALPGIRTHARLGQNRCRGVAPVALFEP
jgi:hypothetical protein